MGRTRRELAQQALNDIQGNEVAIEVKEMATIGVLPGSSSALMKPKKHAGFKMDVAITPCASPVLAAAEAPDAGAMGTTPKLSTHAYSAADIMVKYRRSESLKKYLLSPPENADSIMMCKWKMARFFVFEIEIIVLTNA